MKRHLLFACVLLGCVACKKDEETRSVEYRASCYSCMVTYKTTADDYGRVDLDTVWHYGMDTTFERAYWSTTAEVFTDDGARIMLVNDGALDSARHDTCEAFILVDGTVVRSQRITSIGGNIDLGY